MGTTLPPGNLLLGLPARQKPACHHHPHQPATQMVLLHAMGGHLGRWGMGQGTFIPACCNNMPGVWGGAGGVWVPNRRITCYAWSACPMPLLQTGAQTWPAQVTALNWREIVPACPATCHHACSLPGILRVPLWLGLVPSLAILTLTFPTPFIIPSPFCVQLYALLPMDGTGGWELHWNCLLLLQMEQGQ